MSKNKPTPKQNKHKDPFFRAKIRRKTGKRMSIFETWEEYCKKWNISLPKCWVKK